MKIKEFLKKRWRNVAMIALLVCLIGSMAVPAMAQVVIIRPPLVVDDVPVDGATTDPVSSNWAYDHQTVTNAPTGFSNRTDSTLSWAGTTLTIDKTNGSFDYYIAGVQYTKTASEGIAIDDTTSGAHVIYYDGAVLSESVNPSDAAMEDLILNKALVAIIYWNATDNAAYVLADERHGCQMSGRTHLWIHEVTGAAYHNGFTLSGYTEDTDSDAALTFELTDGAYADEDLLHTITDGSPANQYEQQLNGGDAEIPIVYKDDVDGSWKEDAATTLPYKSLGAGRLAYNKDDGDGTFSQVEVTDGKWVSMTLIATNDWQYPIKAIQGQNEYTDKKTAVEEATNELISFGGGTLSPEVLVLYRLVLNTKDAFGGTKKTKIEVDGVTDFRTSTVIGGAAVASDHGALAGLADDDHAQYLLVADLENPPIEDESAKAPTSEWAFDHDAATTGIHGAGAETLLNSGDGQLFNFITPVLAYSIQAVSSTPRTATVLGVAGAVITLTANEAYRFWSTLMNPGGCYLKIANTSKLPVEYAWVKSNPAVNQLEVTVAGDIAGWVNTDIISTAYDGAVSQYLEFDLSPIAAIVNGTKAVFGRIFLRDTGAIAVFKGLDIKTATGTGATLWCYQQVTGISTLAYGYVSIDSNKHILLRDRTAGVDTIETNFEIIGYLI